MKLKFTNFHPLIDLVQVNIHGELQPGWNGDYVDCSNGDKKYQQPSTGSGFSIAPVRLLATEELPVDLQDQIERAASNGGNGWIYILRSSQYNILYVGISEKSLATGVFSDGRVRHHLRKLLAARGGATNHTKGWHEHAIERYTTLCDPARQPDRTGHTSLVLDLHVSIAHVADPKEYEKFVLTEYAKRMDEPMILNRACNGSLDMDVELELPSNTPSIYSEHINFEPFDLEETEPYEQAGSANEDYAQYIKAMPQSWQNEFKQALTWARQTLPQYDTTITEGVIGNLTHQPDGFSAIPLVGFARRNINGGAMPHGWFTRIPLAYAPDRLMTVILPLRLRADGLADDKICRGQGANFRPVDLADFLRNPEHYIDLSKDERPNPQRTSR